MNKSKKKRIRRIENKSKDFSLKILGNNCNSLLSKLESLEYVLCVEKPSVICLQETKLGRPHRIKTPSSGHYTWYELHRTKSAEKGEKGGGLAIGVLNLLQPSWISEGDDNAEALTVEVWLDGFPVRIVCAYGPQEYDNSERKDKFWDYLEREVQNASNSGARFVLEMDGNLWAGSGIIKRDPKQQNENGKCFQEFLLKYPHLSVTNDLPLCERLFTREKTIQNVTQKTIIDFFCDM